MKAFGCARLRRRVARVGGLPCLPHTQAAAVAAVVLFASYGSSSAFEVAAPGGFGRRIGAARTAHTRRGGLPSMVADNPEPECQGFSLSCQSWTTQTPVVKSRSLLRATGSPTACPLPRWKRSLMPWTPPVTAGRSTSRRSAAFFACHRGSGASPGGTGPSRKESSSGHCGSSSPSPYRACSRRSCRPSRTMTAHGKQLPSTGRALFAAWARTWYLTIARITTGAAVRSAPPATG
jgi:hypothetical protein